MLNFVVGINQDDMFVLISVQITLLEFLEESKIIVHNLGEAGNTYHANYSLIYVLLFNMAKFLRVNMSSYGFTINGERYGSSDWQSVKLVF
jgi:hypothetical protein